MASICPGSQAKSKEVPKAGQQQLKRAKSGLQHPLGVKWEGHRLPVWVTTSGSVKQCEAWGLENHCNVSKRARGFTHKGLHWCGTALALG